MKKTEPKQPTLESLKKKWSVFSENAFMVILTRKRKLYEYRIFWSKEAGGITMTIKCKNGGFSVIKNSKTAERIWNE